MRFGGDKHMRRGCNLLARHDGFIMPASAREALPDAAMVIEHTWR